MNLVVFFRDALLAAGLVGVAAPSIGVYLVQRRLSLMGDGIGHVAFTGVAAGFLTGTSPALTAGIAATIGAVVIEVLRERGIAGDVALALIFYGGIAGGVLLTGLADVPTTRLFGFLFGQPLAVNEVDLAVTFGVVVLVLVVTLGLRKQLFAVSYDEDVARASGLPVRALNIVIAVVAAVMIAVTMRVVGVLLVAAMLVLPVAAAQQLTSSFRATVLVSIAIGVAVSVGGLMIAIYADLFPAATIVFGGIGAFGLTAIAARLREAR
ncbi:MAG: metal ABC transporter permease [Actinomycetota bacterium]